MFFKTKPKDTPEKNIGVKRVNNLPIYIISGIVGISIFILVIACMNTTNQQNNNTNNSNKSDDLVNTQFYSDQIISNHNSGTIIPSTLNNKSKISNKDNTNDIPKLPLLMPQSANNNELDEIKKQKVRLFFQSLSAKTKVDLNLNAINKKAVDTPNYPTNSYNNPLDIAFLGKDAFDNNSLSSRMLEQKLQQISPQENRSNNNYDKFNNLSNSDRWTLNQTVKTPQSKYVIQTGFVIPAIMISGVNSDLPGSIIAQVSQNVYDTPTGKYKLIPQGSKLFGTYSSEVKFGQSRILIAWQRILFPNGTTLDIGSMPGADIAGYSGFKDKVNNHFLRIYSSAILMSGIIAGPAYVKDKHKPTGINVATTPSLQDELEMSLAQELGEVSAKTIEKNLDISPTLEIRPGYKFNVILTKDLIFKNTYR